MNPIQICLIVYVVIFVLNHILSLFSYEGKKVLDDGALTGLSFFPLLNIVATFLLLIEIYKEHSDKLPEIQTVIYFLPILALCGLYFLM